MGEGGGGGGREGMDEGKEQAFTIVWFHICGHDAVQRIFRSRAHEKPDCMRIRCMSVNTQPAVYSEV